ncbi:uncharacterized protein LOC131143864 [Malania oleifera]|uniref:uncharacterized protein LOC131143864 n=1 Tax=Malania oleifera TaxID=397392 RepID=UPI0025ADB7C8|nr:uncharacterized protein LOC131143864 [Malania oleifera]
MTEVVKKEVLKVLDANIIYPITNMSHSPWFDDIVSYLIIERTLEHGVTQDMCKFFAEIKIILEKTVFPNRKDWLEKLINFLLDNAKGLRKLQVCELKESKREVYDKAYLATKQMKLLHDNKIKDKQLFPNQQVLFYDSRLHLFPGKLKSRWGDSYIFKHVHPHSAVEIVDPKNDNDFTVNGQWLKPFLTSFDPNEDVLLLQDPRGL